MSRTWLISGKVRKSRNHLIRDLFSKGQPDHGQINEMLLNLESDEKDPPTVIVGIVPGPSDTIEEIADEIKTTVIWALQKQNYKPSPENGHVEAT